MIIATAANSSGVSDEQTVLTPTDVLFGSERYGLVQLRPLRLYTVLEWVCVFSMLVAIAWVVSASPQHRPVGGLV